MATNPIELDIRARDPVELRMPDRFPVEWNATEYIPVKDPDAQAYEGPYEVTPTAYEQELSTSGAYMAQDVTIHQVPYLETSNESGGYTVSILS